MIRYWSTLWLLFPRPSAPPMLIQHVLCHTILIIARLHLEFSNSVWRTIWYSQRVDSRFAPSQWETALLYNDVSHWLGANLESTLQSDKGMAWKGNKLLSKSIITLHVEWCLDHDARTWKRFEFILSSLEWSYTQQSSHIKPKNKGKC